MPHPRAEVFWQIPSATDKMQMPDKCPGVGGMGTPGIDWAPRAMIEDDHLIEVRLIQKSI